MPRTPPLSPIRPSARSRTSQPRGSGKRAASPPDLIVSTLVTAEFDEHGPKILRALRAALPTLEKYLVICTNQKDTPEDRKRCIYDFENSHNPIKTLVSGNKEVAQSTRMIKHISNLQDHADPEKLAGPRDTIAMEARRDIIRVFPFIASIPPEELAKSLYPEQLEVWANLLVLEQLTETFKKMIKYLQQISALAKLRTLEEMKGEMWSNSIDLPFSANYSTLKQSTAIGRSRSRSRSPLFIVHRTEDPARDTNGVVKRYNETHLTPESAGSKMKF